MACSVENFNELADQPDQDLKVGLKKINSGMLKTSLIPEEEGFVDRILRVMSPVMASMIKDDLEAMRGENKSEEAINEARERVLKQYILIQNEGNE